MFRLLFITGYPSNKTNINFSENLHGFLVYDKDTIRSEFKIRNSIIKNENNTISLFDKKLLKLNFTANAKKIDFERINFDNKLNRKIIDTPDIKVYDNHLVYEVSDIKFPSLIFNYNGQFFKIKNSIFRNRKKNLIKTLNSINTPVNTKSYLLTYFK